MPSLISHTDSRDNPPIAREAKGAPLSVRIASGRPYWRKADLEDGFDLRRVGLSHRLTAQEVARAGIRNGQRIDALAVLGAAPALEIGTPHAIGLAGRGERRRVGFDAPPLFASDGQSFAAQ
jgi:hypothetical protein